MIGQAATWGMAVRTHLKGLGRAAQKGEGGPDKKLKISQCIYSRESERCITCPGRDGRNER